MSVLHIELEHVQDPEEGFWRLRYTDSKGNTGLSTRTWGSAASARKGADAFFERIWEEFEAAWESEL